eukprot:CAMPEP_0167765814 /NCGR_PEP_ID=MMETSP0110_2-20121227/14933_1 /TAXON_ID=629695 /ORGANISM="Gymnochlora sp., Strain CCMP2014" /LENGTH=62 /DNA_ID=CAMNT_0007653643 /DNA_START=1 /DNA_END=185 /DNA_ORIENTATION=-
MRDKLLRATVANVDVVGIQPTESVVVTYNSQAIYKHIATKVGIQPDYKNGDPRSSFAHINAV